MLTYLINQGDLQGIAAGAHCTAKIPVQYNHHMLHLNCLDGGVALTQAQIENDIHDISITLTTDKGVVKILDQITPAEIFDLMIDYPDLARDTTYVNAGVLPIPFSRPGRVRAANMALSLGMKDVQSYTIDINLDAGLANLDQMNIISEVDLEEIRPLGEHIEMRLETRAFAAIAIEQYIDAPHNEPGIGLLASHIGLGTAPGVVGDVEVIVGTQTMYPRVDAAVNNFLLHKRALTPNADYWHIDFTRNFNYLVTSQLKSLLYRINWTTAPVAYRMIHEVVAGLGQSNT